MSRMFVLLILCAAIGLGEAQTLKDRIKGQYPAGVAYYFDFVNMEAVDSITTKLDVFVQVPFNKVKFVKAENVFQAAYSITVSIYTEDEKLVEEKNWEEKLQVNNFRETMSQKNYNISRKTFNLKPGAYLAKLLMEDHDSKQTFPGEVKITVRDMQKPVSLSDPVIVLIPEEGSQALHPNVSHIVHTKDRSIPFFVQVFSRTDTVMKIAYYLVGKEAEVFATKQELRRLKKGKNQIVQAFDTMHVATGDCKIIIRVLNTDGTELIETHRGLTVRLSGLPMIINDLDKAIDQLLYIASGSEIDTIKAGVTYEGKLHRFMEFWKKNDKNEATEENEIFNEYYNRVDYANRNFGHYLDGWKTDMGMVFIYLGMPSNIDRHPFDYDSKPYEVWEYYELNRRFVFVDYTGFGDYRLTAPFPGDLYRFQ